MARHCRSNSARSTGQRRAEVTISTLTTSGTISVGLVEASVRLHYETPRRVTIGNLPEAGNQVGISSYGDVYSKLPGVSSEQAVASIPVAMAEGDVIGVDADFTGGIVSFTVNGATVYTSVLPSGTYYLAVGVSPGCEALVNLAQNVAMAGPFSIGYTDWDGNALGTVVPVSTTLTYEAV